MLRAIGIAVAIGCRLLHYWVGDNDVYASIALYFMLENLGLALICLSGFKERLAYRLVAVNGFCYFTSAIVFYTYALVLNQKIYFSGCGEAGEVLSWLMAAATLFTFFHAYAHRK